ncbi:MAG: hypothetical protein A3C58_00295 [Candidatus Staskawiczbacteria bacterium RIFCSPHIGHO2_02_FULL_34_10]|uniref:Uncharacterized protein n=1 Tax=Candidatus Staskawiczbacteria bacterium RIFCSPHIGHO2_02_FULL_34_10 TaxID=1802205 RepID=A0A1G2HTV9_9BACT|nr:MAG: hypothetical protein A3C58_00295 [Candidatus Staskawiczbacteria bacterium RIFCSPHIGHO2_02_FULL_34_10]
MNAGNVDTGMQVERSFVPHCVWQNSLNSKIKNQNAKLRNQEFSIKILDIIIVAPWCDSKILIFGLCVLHLAIAEHSEA